MLTGVRAVVDLLGESLAQGRWTAKKKARILDSRLRGTLLLAETIAGTSPPPDVLISASAKEYYGDRGNSVLSEQDPPGNDFLAHVIQHWESVCRPAVDAGVRIVNLGSGVVLSRAGAVLD